MNVNELDALRAENDRLREKVTELQGVMTRLHISRQADDLHCQVYEFHQAMGLPCLSTPTIPSDLRIKNRLALSTEEFFEQLEACFPVNPSLRDAVMDEVRYCTPRVRLPDLVDAWCDMNYVHQGSALEFGVDLKPLAREVHRTNMLKKGGTVLPTGKLMKPAGWEPPRIEVLLMKQGWISGALER